jgi:hypothetical protein
LDDRKAQLSQVGVALRGLRRLSRRGDGRQQEAYEHGDDRDDDQHLDQGETRVDATTGLLGGDLRNTAHGGPSSIAFPGLPPLEGEHEQDDPNSKRDAANQV